jgi:hypothetical protein
MAHERPLGASARFHVLTLEPSHHCLQILPVMTVHDAARIDVRTGIGTERVPSVQIFNVELPIGV